MTMQPADFSSVDYYTDPSLVDDPFPYFEYLRKLAPVQPLPHRGVVAVTGYEEGLQVMNDPGTFSSINAITGPFPPLAFPALDDLSGQMDDLRRQMPMTELLITFDEPRHMQVRSILMRLFTPRRLKAVEAYLYERANQVVDEFADRGEVEIFRGYGSAFAGMVIADLLGVPDEDRAWFRAQLSASGTLASIDQEQAASYESPLDRLDAKFSQYIEARRQNPCGDLLSEIATATFPDGSLPSVSDIVRHATTLFGAGQDTTAQFVTALMRIIAENPDIQADLRADAGRIPDFIEEGLRMVAPTKTNHRMVVKSTTLGGVDLPAGTTVAVIIAAMNRDPRRFEAPYEFRMGRPRSREHFAFGRGPHTCPGAALARAETLVSIEQLLRRLPDVRISEAKHGPPESRRFNYQPTYIMRGLEELWLDFTPTSTPVAV